MLGKALPFFTKNIIIPGPGYNLELYKCLSELINTHKGEIKKNIQIDISETLGYDIVNKDTPIYENEVIGIIPFKSGINSYELDDIEEKERKGLKENIHKGLSRFFSKEKNLENYEKNYNHTILIYELLTNYKYDNANSHFLVKSFPTECFNLPMISLDNISQIRSITLKSQLSNYCYFVKEYHEALTEGDVFPMYFGDFLHFYNIANNKKIEVETEKGNLNLIYPVIELLNHNFDPNVELVIDWDQNRNETVIYLLSKRRIEPNESLSINYGSNLTNLSLAKRYGFVIPNNKNVNWMVQIIFEDLNTAFSNINNNNTISDIIDFNHIRDFSELLRQNQDYKFSLFDKLNQPFNNYVEFCSAYFDLYTNKFDINYLALLRISQLSNKEISLKSELIQKHDFTNVWSKENEERVLKYIINVLKLHFSQYKDVDYDSEIEFSKKNVINKDTNDLYLVKELEKEERMVVEKNIKYITKKLELLKSNQII